jgi:hypothetical protein
MSSRRRILNETPSDQNNSSPSSFSNDLNNNSLIDMSSKNDSTLSSFSSTPNKDKTLKEFSLNNGNKSKFQATIDFVGVYLNKVVQQEAPFSENEQNKLTFEVNFTNTEKNSFFQNPNHHINKIRLLIWPIVSSTLASTISRTY